MRFDNLSEVHTLSQTKVGSVPIPSNLQERLHEPAPGHSGLVVNASKEIVQLSSRKGPNLSLWFSFCLDFLLSVKTPLIRTTGTANPAAHQAWTIQAALTAPSPACRAFSGRAQRQGSVFECSLETTTGKSPAGGALASAPHDQPDLSYVLGAASRVLASHGVQWSVHRVPSSGCERARSIIPSTVHSSSYRGIRSIESFSSYCRCRKRSSTTSTCLESRHSTMQSEQLRVL